MSHGFLATEIAWNTLVPHSTDRLVLLAIAKFAGEDLLAYPSIPKICLVTGLDRKTVGNSISRMVSLGIIEKGKGKRNSNVYRIVSAPEIGSSPKNGTTEIGTTENGSTPKNGTTSSPKNGPTVVPKTGLEHIKEQINEQMKKEYIGEDCKGEDIEPVGIDEANAALDEFACDLLQDPVILFDGQAHIGDEVIDIPKVAEPAPKPKRKPREKKEIDTSSVNFYDLPTDLIADFKKHRKAKKATITQRVVDSIKREAESIGWTLEKAVEEMINRGWQGFKAEWVNRSTSIPKKEGTGVNRKTFGPEVYAGCDDTWGF